MAKADFLELIGRDAEAKEIARNVLPKAQAMNYTITISRAEEHLSGQGFRSKQDLVTTEKTEEEKILGNANLSDEKIHTYAVQALRIYGLPVERLPIMKREYLSVRESARDTISWCRYMERRVDDRHERHPSTMYKIDPDRICICTLYGFQSLVPNPDWNVISAAFKKTFCEKCPDRNPIQTKQDMPQ